MIHPSCAEVLATIQTGFEEQVVPHLHDIEARSAAATIGHLLRHVALRIEHEGQILLDDIARLEALLGGIAAWFETCGAGDPRAIRAALTDDSPQGVYPGLGLLGERAMRLRGALVKAQEVLHGLPDDGGLREAVRGYIAAQLAEEARLIEPAFRGKGPRR